MVSQGIRVGGLEVSQLIAQLKLPRCVTRCRGLSGCRHGKVQEDKVPPFVPANERVSVLIAVVATTQGKTREEVKKNLREAMVHLKAMADYVIKH